MKALIPSHKENKRYLLIRGKNLKSNIEKAILEFIGVLGMSKTGLSWIKSAKIEHDYLVVDAPKDSASRINQALTEQGIFASELCVHNTSLENVFLEITGGNRSD